MLPSLLKTTGMVCVAMEVVLGAITFIALLTYPSPLTLLLFGVNLIAAVMTIHGWANFRAPSSESTADTVSKTWDQLC